jgi:pilus assembly protein CpaC
MRAKTVISIACCTAWSLVFCAWPGLQAQAAPPPVQSAGSYSQDSANELSVAVGKSVLVDTALPIMRVAIGQGDVAEVSATSPTEVMVEGKAVGETSLIIWDTHGGRQFFNVTVRPGATIMHDNLDAIRRELKTELPGDSLRVSYENGAIFLRGSVKDLNSSDRAVKIASTGGKVVNLLNVSVPASDPQILLKVRFISVDRTKASSFGINIFNLGAGNFISGLTTGQFTPPVISSGSGGTGAVASQGTQATFTNELNLLGFYPGLGLGVDIQALATKTGGQVLAEPNLLAANGKQASFLAGGEYPYPVVQGGSGGAGASVTIMFKEYGVRLNFIPTVTPRGTIRLQVAPEVSALDFSDAVEISGFEVPAITTRKVKTEVELADGQSFVIGGLLNNTESETFSKIPFLGDIPVLGKFFQSMSKTKANTELIVIVTPEIVAPIPAGGPLPELKFPAKFLPPNSGIPMNTPDAKTAANTPTPAPPTMPVEKLIDSMRPETPLVIEGATGTFGGASSATGASATPAPTTP